MPVYELAEILVPNLYPSDNLKMIAGLYTPEWYLAGWGLIGDED